MRQFDNNVSYFDNSGNILIGRVRFCNLDGTPATIYASDEVTALENPIFTNSSGRLEHQVFLEDHDYLVYFDKYTGVIEMQEEDPDNSEVWEFQSSTINRYKTFDLKLDTEGIPPVGTISALRELDPEVVKQESGTSYVQLLGYNEVGDKPSVNYYWDGNNSSRDNGGSIIKKSSTTPGAWILIPAFDYVDVRHFGAFPTETRSGDQNQQIKIKIAKDYAESLGLRTFFHANGTYIYYNVSGLTINRASSSDLARVYVKGSSAATFKNTENIFAYGDSSDDQGSISIYGDVLRTSFNSNNSYTVKLYPSSKLIFDTVIGVRHGLEVSNVDCVFQVKQSSKITFTNCKFFGSKMLAKEVDFTFDNCEIREDLFEEYSPGYLDFNDCVSDIENWESAHNFVLYSIENGSTQIDMKGRSALPTSELPNQGTFEVTHPVTLLNGTINKITAPEIRIVDSVVRDVDCKSVRCESSSIRFYSVFANALDDDSINLPVNLVSINSTVYIAMQVQVFTLNAVNSKFLHELPGRGLESYTGFWVSSNSSIVNCEFLADPARSQAQYPTNIIVYPLANKISNVKIEDCKIFANVRITTRMPRSWRAGYGKDINLNPTNLNQMQLGTVVDGLRICNNDLLGNKVIAETWFSRASHDGIIEMACVINRESGTHHVFHWDQGSYVVKNNGSLTTDSEVTDGIHLVPCMMGSQISSQVNHLPVCGWDAHNTDDNTLRFTFGCLVFNFDELTNKNDYRPIVISNYMFVTDQPQYPIYKYNPDYYADYQFDDNVIYLDPKINDKYTPAKKSHKLRGYTLNDLGFLSVTVRTYVFQQDTPSYSH